MDSNIRYLQFASNIFKILSALVLVGGGLITALIQVPAIGMFVLVGGVSGMGAVTGVLGIIQFIVQVFGLLTASFILYTIGRVLDLLADVGDELFDLRRIRFEQGRRR